jgi:hypothetical protein
MKIVAKNFWLRLEWYKPNILLCKSDNYKSELGFKKFAMSLVCALGSFHKDAANQRP